MDNDSNNPGPLEDALRFRAPYAPVAQLTIKEERPDCLIVAMIQRQPSGGAWCQLIEVRGNSVRFIPSNES